MSIQTMYSHTKEILALTVPFLTVLVVVALMTAGIVSNSDVSPNTAESPVKNEAEIAVQETTITPAITEVASLIEEITPSSELESSEEHISSNAELDIPQVGGTEKSPTATPTAVPSVSATVTSTNTPVLPTATSTPTQIPTVTVTPTSQPAIVSIVKVTVFYHAGNQDITVDKAKIVVKNKSTGEILEEGLTDKDGKSPEWKVAVNTELEIFAYKPDNWNGDYCGSSWTTNTGPYGTTQAQHLRIYDPRTIPCVSE